MMIERRIESAIETSMSLLQSIEKRLKASVFDVGTYQTFVSTGKELAFTALKLSKQVASVDVCPADRIRTLMSAFIVVLSDVFEATRNLRMRERDSSPSGVGEAVWIAPDSFERSTSKYWVEDTKLNELLLTCVGEAPLLVYGQSGSLSASFDILSRLRSDKDVLWDELASTITSIYFDSPRLDLYRDRIMRREGAPILRARWYGKRPKEFEPVFLELKTHHESWVQSKSTKERATILERDMCAFLYPTKLWEAKDAEEVILRANPRLTREKLNTAVDLLLRMHSLVVKLRLRPCVRSTYQRLAFQSSSSNALRLTLDRNIMVSDETKVSPGQWSLDDDIISTKGKGCRCPFSVFEIKLNGDQTATAFHDLIEMQVIMDASKFSKFITGAAIFNQGRVSTLPYWASHPAFMSMFAAAPKPGSSTLPQELRSESVRKQTEVSQSPPPPSCRFSCSRWFDMTRPNVPTSGAWIAPQKSVRVEPKSYFANERTLVQWMSAALFLITMSAFLLEFGSKHDHALLTSNVLAAFALLIALYSCILYYHRIALLRQGRPHGYVTHFGPILMTAAVVSGCIITLYIKTDKTTAMLMGNRAGAGMLIESPNECMRHDLGRLFSPLNFKPSDLILDEPRNLLIVPSFSEIVAFDAAIGTILATGPSLRGGAKPYVAGHVPGAIVEGLVKVGDSLYATSSNNDDKEVSMIYKLDWTTTTTHGPVATSTDPHQTKEESLFVTDSWNIHLREMNGIAFVTLPQDEQEEDDDDEVVVPTLYISGEHSQVESFALPEASSAIHRVDQMTGVQDEEGNKLFLTRLRPLNGHLIRQNLTDGTIGAMTFFEGILYVLHDNDAVVRSWNVHTGTMVSSFELPYVGDKGTQNSRQWVGLSFQRIHEPQFLNPTSPPSTVLTSSQNLRAKSGGPPSSQGNQSGSSRGRGILLLHLALATPAAIWTLVVHEEGVVPGWIRLPDCARPA